MLQSMWSQRVGPDLVTEQPLCLMLMALRHAWKPLLCTLQDNSYTVLCILGEKKSLRHGVLIFKDLMAKSE